MTTETSRVAPASTALTPDVMMVVAMSRLLRDGEIVFHGVASPLPMVAILLAKATHAPNLVYLNITGSIDPEPAHLPRSTVDPALLSGTRSVITLADAFDLSARGELDTVFLSGVQIDGAGRINMSAIGDYAHPRVRLPGGAGSAFLMSTANRILLWRTRHDTPTFVETLPFVTGAGNVDRVITPLCVFRRDPREGRLVVESIHPYTGADEVAANTGFPLDLRGVPTTPPPAAEELEALDRIDPEGVRRIEFGG
ncbi:MAG: CoA-transferase [Chloroflexi bacterium]|nr:CoA-transferase [Chloroflexota bacterium]